MKDAETAIEDQIDHAIEDSTDKVERALDKETNEKCWQSVNIRIPLWRR